MTNPQQNLLPNEFSLKDLLDLHRKDLLLNFNCQQIAKIQSFDSTKQTATATINCKQTYSLPSADGVYADQLVDYPLLADCPVMFLGGGKGALTFPVAAGDDCLVLFNDRDIDNWFAGSSASAPATPRLHSFSDGIILVGVRNSSDVLVNFETDGIVLRTKDGLTKIKILSDGSKVTVNVGSLLSFEFGSGKLKATNATGELFKAISDMFTEITAGTVLGVPIVLPPAYATNLAIVGSFT